MSVSPEIWVPLAIVGASTIAVVVAEIHAGHLTFGRRRNRYEPLAPSEPTPLAILLERHGAKFSIPATWKLATIPAYMLADRSRLWRGMVVHDGLGAHQRTPAVYTTRRAAVLGAKRLAARLNRGAPA